ncbi:hypothetical protein [Methanofollis liminatans]|uniref:hypothetical protein n=1 Tax=Methanofollis liminatans TaxID=2201 RepID=UPI00064FFD69|nr:hypothetical protein [Methanofollis liminatans]
MTNAARRRPPLLRYALQSPPLHGPAGVCIPVGVPLVFAAAWSVWRGEDGDPPDPDSPEADQIDATGDDESRL